MEKFIYKTSGLFIRKFRRSKKYSLEYTAIKTGISKSKICKMENGQQEIDIVSLFKLSELYDISAGGFWSLVEQEYYLKGFLKVGDKKIFYK